MCLPAWELTTHIGPTMTWLWQHVTAVSVLLAGELRARLVRHWGDKHDTCSLVTTDPLLARSSKRSGVHHSDKQSTSAPHHSYTSCKLRRIIRYRWLQFPQDVAGSK